MADFVLAATDGTDPITLPTPLRGLERSAGFIGSTARTLSGNLAVNKVATKRQITITWRRLTDAVFEPIEARWRDDIGPWLLTGPGLPITGITVAITGLTDTIQLLGYHDATLTLEEV